MDWVPIPEANMERTESGELIPASDGWFVVNVAEARAMSSDDLGCAVVFEGRHDGAARFDQFGLNIHVLRPGEPNCMYHRETAQEGYLVLSGECILIVEGEQRRLGPWDYAHLPSGTAHVCVGAGDGPCAVLMVGTRADDEQVLYPVDETAARHGASVETETPSPPEAYAKYAPPRSGPLPWPPA